MQYLYGSVCIKHHLHVGSCAVDQGLHRCVGNAGGLWLLCFKLKVKIMRIKVMNSDVTILSTAAVTVGQRKIKNKSKFCRKKQTNKQTCMAITHVAYGLHINNDNTLCRQ